MILINLLPPELRRRQSGASPIFLSVVVGGSVCAALAALLCYVQFSRIDQATKTLQDANDTLAAKTTQAQAVLDLEAKIDAEHQLHARIAALLGKKLYWARLLDQFVTMLNGPWNAPGFRVTCQDLLIAPNTDSTDRRSGEDASAAPQSVYNFTWHYKLVGDQRTHSGDYLESFFSTIKNTAFWKTINSPVDPDYSYKGDAPKYNDAIQRIIIEGEADWQRYQLLPAKPVSEGR
jgi:hypothetical protein